MRAAMNRSRSGLIIRSWVDTRNHDGSVFHAGGPARSVKLLAAIGFCTAARTRASSTGRSWAKKVGTAARPANAAVPFNTARRVGAPIGSLPEALGSQAAERSHATLNRPKQAVSPTLREPGSAVAVGWQLLDEVAGSSPALWEGKPTGPPYERMLRHGYSSASGWRSWACVAPSLGS